LVVYLDDYVGNQHNLILAENSNGWLTHEMSEWYGAMFISYASVVRRLVYANQQETILSPYWRWWSTKKPFEVHFGLSAHIALTWVMAFAFLSAAVDFCDDGYDDTKLAKLFPDHYPQVILDLVERVTPPPLNGNTQIQNVSDMWLMDAKAGMATQPLKCNHHESQPESCAIAFIAGPMGTTRNQWSLQEYLRIYSRNTYGWIVEDSISNGGWRNKLGYAATERNATTTFYRDSTTSGVRTLTLYYLKSYGRKWRDSRAKVTFLGSHGNQTLVEKSFTLEGFHNSKTSISYEYQLDLNSEEALPPNSRVQVTIQMIKGTSFKIVGLFICDRP
jgi:hypothetical protein